MNPIFTSSFNKQTISWELIHLHLFHPYESVMTEIRRHQTIHGLPKHYNRKLNQASCKICYKAKMKMFSKGTTVDTTKLQPQEITHMDFMFYNMTSIQEFTSMLTVFCANTIIIWLFLTAPSLSLIHIICFIRKTFENEQ